MSDASTPGSRSLARLWAFVRIMNVRLRFIFLMALVGVVSANWERLQNQYDRWRRPTQAPETVQAQQIEYYCPMHPNIIRAQAGNCPICGMPLAKRAKTGRKALAEGVLAQVQMSPQKVQMGRIAATPVQYQLLSREIRTVGIVDYDETRRAFVAARIKGRLDKLFVNYEGQKVEKGAPLALIYSPDLLVAQEELLSAVRQEKDQQKRGEFAEGMGKSLAESARRKLALWDVTEQQVEEIIGRGTTVKHMTIFSPIEGIVTEKKVLEGHYVSEGEDLYTIADLGTVWLQAKVFEDEISGVSVGTAVEVTSVAYPGEVFAGRIAFIAYTVDPGTRTVSARVEIANTDLRLKPGMYVRANVRLPVGKVEELGAAASQASTAPSVDTGALTRAYLALTAAFAEDKTSDALVQDLIKEARRLADAALPEAGKKAKALAETLQPLSGKELAEQRKLFKNVSASLIELVQAYPPSDLTVSTFHCPMAKADWLGVGEEVRNPYYGSEMLECGRATGKIQPRSVQEQERYATGYYCPIYPDRLFDKPIHCPIDKFPIKYSKVEKVLAVPASAVINTGTRTVVYRESDPGTYDMIEVRLGPKAGEFYPVLAGVNAGDRVAASGAFIVDAENRLNPAAGAQYFGASDTQAHQ